MMVLAGLPALTLPAAWAADSETVFAPAADEPGPGTADIFLSAQDGGYIVPKQAATVTADLSDRYGYQDAEGAVSGLDALIRAHQIRYALISGAYDEEGFAAWVHGAVTVSEQGYVTAAFGRSNPSLSLLIDGAMPGEDDVGLAIPDTPVADGGDVEFLIYQDADAMDFYTWFEDQTGKVQAVTTTAGEDLTLTLKGDMLLTMMFGLPMDGDRIVDTGLCEDLPIVALDPATGTAAPFVPAVAVDEDGAFTVRFAAPGTYILSVRGDAYVDIFAPWCVVTVAAPKPALRLADMYLSNNTSENGAFSPAFDGDVTEYTVVLPATGTTAYMRPVAADMEAMNAAGYRWRYTPVPAGADAGTPNATLRPFAAGHVSGSISYPGTYEKILIEILDTEQDDKVLAAYTFHLKYRAPPLSAPSDVSPRTTPLSGEGARYSTHITPDTETVAITVPTSSYGRNVLINGAPAAAGQPFALAVADLTFTDGETDVVIAYTNPDIYVQDTIVTLTLILEKWTLTPDILIQPAAASDYGQDQAGVKALSVYATAAGGLRWQWYRNTADSVFSGTPVAGATEAEFVPPVTTVGVVYYYCVVTSTAEGGRSVASETARVTVFPDPTPVLTVLTPGEPLPDIVGITWTQEIGYHYHVGETEVSDLRVSAVTAAAGYAVAYSWTVRWGNSQMNTSGNGDGSITPVTTSARLGPNLYTVTASVTVGGMRYQTSETIYVHIETPKDYGEAMRDWPGSGTAEDPKLLSTKEDLAALQRQTEAGLPFSGIYFKLTNDIALDDTWKPIGGGDVTGNGRNLKPFSGVLDGGGHTLSFAYDSPPLLLYARRATVKNLNIYGPYINSYGLVQSYPIDYGPTGSSGSGGPTIDIINVTLKSGTTTKLAGFIGGSASGQNHVNIVRCTAEAGVVVGYDKVNNTPATGSNGSFAGGFNGTIVDSVSCATVYGGGGVGGLAGFKGQSMGPLAIRNSAFAGRIVATGSGVGGIMGRGYVSSSAPNTLAVTVENCYVAADITGSNRVGGLFGDEGGLVQAWDNGPGGIRNNVFTGTVTATADPAEAEVYAGGIIGYIRSLNRYNLVTNNYYADTAGVARGIGGVQYVDTSHSSPAAVEGVTYVNTAAGASGISGMSQRNMNRTDDPLGADAGKLTLAATAEQLRDGTVTDLLNRGEGSLENWVQGEQYPVHRGAGSTPTTPPEEEDPEDPGTTPTTPPEEENPEDPGTTPTTPPGEGEEEPATVFKLEIGGDYKTRYVVGESFSTAGMVITATFSNGDTKILTPEEVEFAGFDSAVRGVKTVALRYQTVEASFEITVLYPETSSPATITVYLTLYGDTVHTPPEDGGPTHTLQHGGLTLWIPRNTVFTVSRNATVLDVLEKAMTQAGLTWENPSGNYITSITKDGVTLGERTNGAKSGWMYTLNGSHPLNGVAQQYLENNDRIVFHYTDDYEQEEGAEYWAQSPSGGSKTGDGAAATADGSETPLAGLFPFADVAESDWFYGDVYYMWENSLMNGTSATLFSPSRTLTRGMVVTVLYRAEGEPDVSSVANHFPDVTAGRYYTEAVVWAADHEIVLGYTDGKFGPDDDITREQMAAILYRYEQYAGKTPADTVEALAFADEGSVSAYAKEAVGKLVTQGIIAGKPNNRFNPQGGATRAEFAAVLHRFKEATKEAP
jgi:hypothetical protein